ncbi:MULTISPECIES: NACHT domain-containing protein [Streptomycetaceae]|uniref:NACHT domain-containing protein n=1 Tax=Streptomycetaceae TaxID=2062 RepID=UPI00093B249C|nr:HNH endonuclease signature motif containing protein [Streptomyces sp. CB02056]
MAIKDPDRKILWGRSGNECAFPDCRQRLTDDVGADPDSRNPVVLGEEAHIVAREDDGPRGDPGLPLSDRNSYTNLILLCPTHHTLIDKEHGRHFPVNDLLAMKRAHEDAIDRRREPSDGTPEEWHRRDALLAGLSASRGRLITRWIAVGLTPEQAEGLANDDEIGVCQNFTQFHIGRKFAILTGDFGSGKTVALEREYQKAAVRAIDDPDAPLPIHFTARSAGPDLLRALDERLTRIPSKHHQVTVFLDGLDEFGAERTAEVIDELWSWLYSASGRKVLATSRPDPNLRADFFTLPALSDAELQELLDRVEAPEDLAWHSNADIRDALHRPLFALIAADCHRSGSEVPHSRGAFLAALVERALTRSAGLGLETYTLLARLGRLTLDAGGSIAASEAGNREDLQSLVRTRLVVHRNRTLSFALPVLGQYFGGQYILDNGLPELSGFTPQRRDRWRDALTFAVSNGSWDRVTALLRDLTAVDPGLASWIIDKAVPKNPLASTAALPEDLECARRLSTTLDNWLSGLGHAASLLSCSDEAGRGLPIGVGSDAGSSNIGVMFAAPVVPADRQRFFAVTARPDLERGEIAGYRILSLRPATVPSDVPAWPWQLSLSWVKASMAQVLTHRAFPLPENVTAVQERTWNIARLLTGKVGFGSRLPIPLTDVISAVDEIFRETPNIALVRFRGGAVVLRSELARLRDQCVGQRLLITRDGMIHCPYPVPDVPGPDRTSCDVSAAYSPDVLIDMVRQVYSGALSIYESIVTEYLSPIRRTLQLGGALPVRFACKISWPPIGTDRVDMGPLLLRTVLPLTPGSTSQVDVTEVEDVSAETDYWPDWFGSIDSHAEFRRLRPEAAAWSGRSTVHEVLWIFGESPATTLAYNWLSADLRAIGLSDSVNMSFG